jgi:hypothetical protein
MADTIITNSPEKGGDSGAGWAVALVIIIVLVVGGIILYKKGAFRGNSAAPASNGTNINVSIPGGSSGSSDSGTPNPAQ